MKIVPCPSCGAKFNLAGFAPGKKLRCAKCKEIFVVPEEDESLEEVAQEPEPERQPVAAAARTAQRTGKTAPVTARTGRGRPGSNGDRAGRTAAPRAGRKKKSSLMFGIICLLGVGGAVVAVVFALQHHENRPKDNGAQNAHNTAVQTAYEKQKEQTDFQDPDSVWTLADVCSQLDMHDERQELLMRCLQLKEGYAPALRSLREIFHKKYGAPGMQVPDPPTDAFLSGRSPADKFFALGEWCETLGLEDEAFQCYEKTTSLNRDHVMAWKKQGRVLYMGQIEDAELVEDLTAFWAEEASLSPHQRKVRDKVTAYNQRFGEDSFVFIDSPPYLILIQKDSSYSAETYISTASEILHSLYDTFYTEYGVKYGLEAMQDEMVVVWIYSSSKAYHENESVPEWAGGHFNPGTKDLVLYHAEAGGKPYETWFHEGTHQLVDYAATLKGNPAGTYFWFTEGIATYFEAFRRGPSGEFLLGKVSTEYLPGILPLIKTNKHVPIEELVRTSYNEFRAKTQGLDPFSSSRLAMMYYCESWSFVYFLYTYENGKYRSRFDQYFEKEIEGKGGYDVFKELFNDITFEDLEKQWKEYILSLKIN